MSDERVMMEVPRKLHRKVKLLAVIEDRPINSVIIEALTTGPIGERLAALPALGDNGDARPQN